MGHRQQEHGNKDADRRDQGGKQDGDEQAVARICASVAPLVKGKPEIPDCCNGGHCSTHHHERRASL
jgi:hypothetical protein